MTSPVLQLDRFGVAFGDHVVLRDVSLTINGPGCSVLLGPSGTGKSTLLRALAGFYGTDPALRISGVCLYNGRPCAEDNRPALVVNHSELLLSNVLDNLVCELKGRAAMTLREQIERAAELLGDLGYTHLLDHLLQKVAERPAGDQRAVAILRCLMAQPALVMLDEPTTGIDPIQSASLLEIIRRISARCAVLVVLHHLQQARQLANQVVLLADGKLGKIQAAPEFFDALSSGL